MTSTPRKRADASVPDISVIVPVLNEAGNIRPLIDEICDAFSGRDFEIIYVDDASTDDGLAELAQAIRDIPQLRVLRHERRAGQSAAIRSALGVARGDLVGVLDGDGQNVPADLPKLEKRAEGSCCRWSGDARHGSWHPCKTSGQCKTADRLARGALDQGPISG